MISKEYRENALEVYGEACEICGHRASVEVHHINYQEHQTIENEIRKAFRLKWDTYPVLVEKARKQGFELFYEHSHQLAKDDDTKNLAVLCGNCHTLIHKLDAGMKIHNVLKERKSQNG